MRWRWEQCDSTEYRSQQHISLHFLMSRSTWADHCFWRVIEEMKNSFKISWAKKNPKSLFFAVDLYTVQLVRGGGERCVMAKKGFEGIKAVAASYLRLHPEVCACVYLLLCVCVCLCLWLCVCVSVFLCVCLIWPSNNYSANLVVRPATFHTNSHRKISALVHPAPLLVRPPFFRSEAFIGNQQQKLGNEALIFILKTPAFVLLARAPILINTFWIWGMKSGRWNSYFPSFQILLHAP